MQNGDKQWSKRNLLLGGGLLLIVILILAGVFLNRSRADWVSDQSPGAEISQGGFPRKTPFFDEPLETPTPEEPTPTSSVPTQSPDEVVTGPTLTPTPTQTPVASNAIQGVVSMVASGGIDYEAVVSGSGDTRLIHIPSDGDIRIGQTGLIWGEDDEEPGWEIDRALLEFDTTSLKQQPIGVILRFRMIVKRPGFAVPQTVHSGTWSGEAAAVPPAELWQAYDPLPLATFLENGITGLEPPVTLEKTVEVPLPPTAIVIGGVTRLVVRTTLEGEAPPVGNQICETCMQIVVYDDVNLLIDR